MQVASLVANVAWTLLITWYVVDLRWRVDKLERKD